MIKEFYQEYFEAVKQILDGNPVKNLEEIRNKCDLKFFRRKLLENPNYVLNPHPEMISISVIADAENEILMGENFPDIYKDSEGHKLPDMMKKGKKILEDAVKYSLN